ncbi:hypothetical protein SEVIR_8G159666v4 [Setaria viridis]
MRTAFFDQNGGKILKGAAGINIFTEKQLKKFTNHYDTLIGRGAFGRVFMGTTDKKQRVEVKRSIIEDKELRGRAREPSARGGHCERDHLPVHSGTATQTLPETGTLLSFAKCFYVCRVHYLGH